MFKHSCFIKKNTEDLKKQLEELGYSYSGFDNQNNDCLATSIIPKNYSIINEYLIETNNPHTSWGINRVDCGENIDLFLAIAALRSDSDYNQWFILEERYGEDDYGFLEVGSWHFCKEANYKNYFPIGFKCRKASLKEIQDHFKES